MATETAEPTKLGNYDIESKIAEGGMGTVYKARNRVTGEIVAVKVIASATAKNPVLLQRFEREFMAARVLDHPNVVRAIDYSASMPHPYLVMEYVDGSSIGQRIEKKGAYPEAEAVRLIGQVCDGLQRAHKQGLVHRDVKPDNILVTQDGTAKLTDLGLVKEVDGDLNLTKTGRGLGTPHYMAPEQFRNAKTVDVRGDIYSLGATLYAMITGIIPFDNASPLDCWMKKIRNEFAAPKSLNPAISERVDWAIRRAMSAEPGQRPVSCREFMEDLTGASRSIAGSAARPGPTAAPANADVWYLVYRDETNQSHTVKGSTEGIRKALGDNLLGDPSDVLVCRTKQGHFVALGSVAEFRDLVVAPEPMQMPSARSTPSPDETTNLDAQQAAGAFNPRGRSSGTGRAVPVPPPVPMPLPPPPPSRVQRPVPGASSAARYSRGQGSAPQPAPTPRQPAQPQPESLGDDNIVNRPTPFDWTPVLLVVVMILSGVIGYLIFAK